MDTLWSVCENRKLKKSVDHSLPAKEVTKDSTVTSGVTESTTTAATATATTTTTADQKANNLVAENANRTETSEEEVEDDNSRLETENLEEFMERMSKLIAKMVAAPSIDWFVIKFGELNKWNSLTQTVKSHTDK